MATATGGLQSVEAARPGSIGAWRTGRLVYVSATLGELVADANRFSTRHITLDPTIQHVDGITVTASFDSSDIDGLLAALPGIFPVTIDGSDSHQIVIRSRPAQ